MVPASKRGFRAGEEALTSSASAARKNASAHRKTSFLRMERHNRRITGLCAEQDGATQRRRQTERIGGQQGGGEKCGLGPGLRCFRVDGLIDLVRQDRRSPLRQFLQIALDLDHKVAHHPPGAGVHQTDLQISE